MSSSRPQPLASAARTAPTPFSDSGSGPHTLARCARSSIGLEGLAEPPLVAAGDHVDRTDAIAEVDAVAANRLRVGETALLDLIDERLQVIARRRGAGVGRGEHLREDAHRRGV